MKTVDHIAIRVKDIDKCRKWWEEYCNARCVFSTDSYHRMQLSNTTIALIDETAYEHDHVGILVNYKENLPKDGVIIRHRDETIGSYVRDPEGNVVEFIYYSPNAKKKIGLKSETSNIGTWRKTTKIVRNWGLRLMETILRIQQR
jgi:catechol 2,3-dioxygenase-like lactoylglutathione lyase family enzyme